MATGKQDARFIDQARRHAKDFETRLKRVKRMPETGRHAIEASIREFRQMLIEAEIDDVKTALERLEGLVERELVPYEKSAWREYLETLGIAAISALFLRAFVIGAFRIPSGSMKPTLLVGDNLFATKLSYGIRVPFGSTYLVRWAQPARGDVVVFSFPREEAKAYLQMQLASMRSCLDPVALEEERDMIKRVIGLPGDVVEVTNKLVKVNGVVFERAFMRQDATGDWARPRETVERESNGARDYTVRFVDARTRDFGPITVKPDHVFVMGDNRDESADGRCWGQVPIENIEGRARILWWSNGPDGVRWERFGKLIK